MSFQPDYRNFDMPLENDRVMVRAVPSIRAEAGTP
jgi:hypothetical protein